MLNNRRLMTLLDGFEPIIWTNHDTAVAIESQSIWDKTCLTKYGLVHSLHISQNTKDHLKCSKPHRVYCLTVYSGPPKVPAEHLACRPSTLKRLVLATHCVVQLLSYSDPSRSPPFPSSFPLQLTLEHLIDLHSLLQSLSRCCAVQ